MYPTPKITVIQGDITNVNVDAIVNAAKPALMGGGGVDGAIHRAGGPDILEECMSIRNRLGPIEAGEAVITTAGKLTAKNVIHTVGPIWKGGLSGEEKKLANCYTNSLRLAAKNECRSIAFPNISTGIYRFPREKAAVISLNAIRKFLERPSIIQKVILVCYDPENYHCINKLLKEAEKETSK